MDSDLEGFSFVHTFEGSYLLFSGARAVVYLLCMNSLAMEGSCRHAKQIEVEMCCNKFNFPLEDRDYHFILTLIIRCRRCLTG